MARIRYLKPDFFKDEDLATLPFEARLFFAGLWNFADKAGRLEDRPVRLKVDIFPYDKVDIDKCLNLLSKLKNGSNKPFIQRYAVNGEKFIQIVNWDKHQRPHHTEAESKIPPAPPLMEKGMGMGMENQLNPSKELRNGERTVKQPLEEKKKNFFSPAQEYFYLKYKEKTGKEYVADFAKDGKIFKELSKVIVDVQQFKEVINRFFNSEDEFIIKAGYTVGVFRTQINKLQMDIIPRSELRKEFGLK